jgi:choline kinase
MTSVIVVSPLSPVDNMSIQISHGIFPIFLMQAANCLSCGVPQFVLLLGDREDKMKHFVDKVFRGIRISYVLKERYRETNTGYTLMLAATAIGTAEFITFDADVVFDAKSLPQLVDSKLPNVLCIDQNVALVAEEVKVITVSKMHVVKIGKSLDPVIAWASQFGLKKNQLGKPSIAIVGEKVK